MKRIYTLFLLVSFSVFFSTQIKAQTYCTSGAYTTNDDDISNVTIIGVGGTFINNTSSCSGTYSDFTYLPAVSMVPGAPYTLSVTLTQCNGYFYSNWCALYIDWNHNYSFTDAGELIGIVAASSSWPSTHTYTINVPGTATIGYTRMRLVQDEGNSNPPSCGMYSYGETEDYTVNIITPGPMSITSVSSSQPITTPVFQGQNLVKILSADIGTYGVTNPFFVKRAYFSTNGTTNVSDIAKARLFKYDNSPLVFTDTFGAPKIAPNGSFYFDVYDTLGSGNSHFILAYDVNPNASVGNVLDATFDSIVIADTMRHPSITSPTGSRSIVQYFSYTGYCMMGVTNIGTYQMGVSKFVMTDALGAVLFNNATASLQTTTLYPKPNPTVFRQSHYNIQIKGGPTYGEQEVVWVDWNNDGIFDPINEQVSFKTYGASATVSDSFTVPCTATTGDYHRMRVASDYSYSSKPIPCTNLQYGDAEDYIIYISNDPTPTPTYARPTLAYTFSQTHFINTTSSKGNIVYSWDFTNSGTFTQTAKNGVTSFTSPGKKIVTLKATVYGCDSTYSRFYTDTVTVVNPTRTPKTDFIASKNIAAVFDQIDINDLSEFGPSDWKWVVTPDFVNNTPAWEYVNGTSEATQNISLVFYEPGYYTVKLMTTNMIGDDSIAKVNYIFVAESVDMCTIPSSDKIAGFLYDDGGKGGIYSANQNCNFLINPNCNTSITLKFSAFDVSTGGTGDWLKVYDGKNNSGIPLHTQAGYPQGFQNNGANVPILPPDVTATSGSMYIEWHADGSYQNDGFAATWTAQLMNVAKPTANLSGPDTVFQKVPATFVDLSTGTELQIQWDTNNDGFYQDAQDSIISRFWDTTGTFNIGVMAQSCAKYDTFNHPVVVIRPKNKPTANFEADFRRVPLNYPIMLTDKSVQTGTLYKWKWTITPSTYIALDGTDIDDQNIKVAFTDTGYYSIKLIGTNAVGTDSITKTSYIYAYETCTPDVSNLTTDVGFSSVYIEDSQHDTLITNTSLIGQSAYTDYSSTKIASVYQGGTYMITLQRTTTFNNISRTVWVDFNQDGDFTDPGEQVINDINAPNLSQTYTFKIPTNSNTGFAAMRIAANAGILSNKPCGPNYTGEFEDYGLFIKVDDVPPVITLFPPTSMTINSCASYINPGYSAWANVGGNITAQVIVTGANFNTKIAGVHLIKYNVTAANGIKAKEQIRTVTVLADIVNPTITLNGNNPDSVLVLSVPSYSDKGYIATDNCSGIKSKSNSGNVDTKKLGTYNITYTATDSAGNIVTVIRSVIVYDNVTPSISKIGKDTIYVDVKTPYVEPGVTVTDNYWKNLVVNYTGSVNTSKVGMYILTYCVTDSSGNGPVCTDRYVIVRDIIAPVITLIGDTVILDVKRSFTDPGYYVTDNYWSSNYLIITKTGFVNINKIGDYILTYIAKDASGNISPSLTRLVRVVDRIAPTINLLGQTIMSIPRWSTFEDPDVTVKDNYYTNAELITNYNTHGTFKNTLLTGLYSYTYSVCDPSNNCSQEITRLIFVEEGTSTNTGLVDNNIKYYPNPANNILNIDIDLPKQTPVEISIYNNLGEVVSKVFTGTVTKSSFKVDVSSFSSGIYIIRFNIDKEQTVNKKLLITK